MANLTAKAPADLAAVTIGTVTLTEHPMGSIWAIMPYHGATDVTSSALKAAHGVGFPAPGTVEETGDIRIVWSGQGQAFLFGTKPETALGDHAGLSDQSDAWTHLCLEGEDAQTVLTRLVPIDLSLAALPVNRSARSSLGHMSALIIRTGEARFELLCFRSMAGTMVHELERAMKMIAARQAL